jgi:transposase, IS5 family
MAAHWTEAVCSACSSWHFGMKAHIGTDVHGRVHSLATTHAGAADITQLPKLLHGNERVLYGDQAYWSADHREAPEQRASATA